LSLFEPLNAAIKSVMLDELSEELVEVV